MIYNICCDSCGQTGQTSQKCLKINEMLQVFGAVGSRSQQTTNILDLEGTLLQASNGTCCWPSTGHKTRWLLWFMTHLFLMSLIPTLRINFSIIPHTHTPRAFYKAFMWPGCLLPVCNLVFWFSIFLNEKNRANVKRW